MRRRCSRASVFESPATEAFLRRKDRCVDGEAELFPGDRPRREALLVPCEDIADLQKLDERAFEHFRLYLWHERTVDHIVEVQTDLSGELLKWSKPVWWSPTETTVDLSGNTRGVVVELHRERSVERARVDVARCPSSLGPPMRK